MDLQIFANILVEQTKTNTTAGGASPNAIITEQVSLAQKAEEYSLLLGNNTAHISSVLVQLLTLGKVRLDFREYNERLVLVNKEDVMSRPDAVHAVEAYLHAIKLGETSSSNVDYTQKIIIQAPKRTVL